MTSYQTFASYRSRRFFPTCRRSLTPHFFLSTKQPMARNHETKRRKT